MKKLDGSIHTLIRYAVLQVPGLVVLILILVLIKRFLVIPDGVFWGIIIVWVLKDVALYPFVWRAYDTGRHGKKDPMIGRTGTAVERLSPGGYVKIRGELWKAELFDTRAVIEKGEPVKVHKIDGLMLIVTKDRENA